MQNPVPGQRRSPLLLMLALISLGLLSCSQDSGDSPGSATPPPDSATFELDEIADGLYTFRWGEHRSLFLVGSDGVIVTDPLNAVAARSYRAAISSVTDRPVRYVVYSHYHWDRVSGAQIFQSEGAQIIAQEVCAERFRDNPNPAVAMPDITFSEEYVVSVGDKSLDLFYFGPSHGDCLTVFVANPANMVQIVDVVNPPHAAFPRNPLVSYIRPHNLRQFFRDLEFLVAERGIETVIASAVYPLDDGMGGEQISPATGPVSIIQEQGLFWDAIYDAVSIARAEGNVGIDSFVKLDTIDVEPFKRYDGYNKEDLPIIMRRFVGYYDMGR